LDYIRSTDLRACSREFWGTLSYRTGTTGLVPCGAQCV